MPVKPRAATPPEGAVYITTQQLRDRYGGMSHMWLERKVRDDPDFPRPTYIGRLRFFKIDEVEAYERACVKRRAAR